ncbi:MAG TPA: HupE/UreJ family protein [Myxococcota bacterium]|jgi:hypothetical protein|nr:HupE/UreJ family protein [Myxococcota bacterium]
MSARCLRRPSLARRLFAPGALLVASAIGAAETAQAHAGSTAFLALVAQQADVHGELTVALRDLDLLLGLDADGDGSISWGELRAREREISATAEAAIGLESAGARCPSQRSGARLAVDARDDGVYAVVPLDFRCAAPPSRLDLRYELLFDLDSLHRGLLRLDAGGTSHTAVFSPEARRQVFALDALSPGSEPLRLVAEGARHVLGGADHVAFLVTLLLPAALVREGGRWRAIARFPEALRAALAVVTAFTLAHSLTLALAALGVVRLPSRAVEPAIAATVALAALHNLRRILPGPAAAIAFSFGLVHGLGFASAFGALALPQRALLRSLFGFNAGVELGQLAIVAALLPLVYALRHRRLYRLVVLQGGSLAVAGLGGAWCLARLGLT